MKVIVYHDDNDGRCAAAITLKALIVKCRREQDHESFVFAGV